MIEGDTIKLLRECDAGVKMGISSIEDVLELVSDEGMRRSLWECKARHESLEHKIQELLDQYHDEGKDPNPVIKGMSWMKTNLKMAMDHSDETIADLMTDGCNMGIKSLRKYLNQYQAADESSKDVTKELIRLEEELVCELSRYLQSKRRRTLDKGGLLPFKAGRPPFFARFHEGRSLPFPIRRNKNPPPRRTAETDLLNPIVRYERTENSLWRM